MTPDKRRTEPTDRIRFALGLLACGLVCAAISSAGVAVVSPLCGFVAVVVLPALAAVQWAGSEGPADTLERAAYAYAGLAVSCWSMWTAALVIGVDSTATRLMPVLISAIVVATLRPAIDGKSRAPDRSDIGVAQWPHTTVWVTAVITVALVAVPFLPYGWQRADGIHRMGMTDWYKHLMVTSALQGPAFPPANPFLIVDDRAPYYYGFHLLAAVIQRAAGGIDLYNALLSLTLVTAAAFPVVVFVVARGLFGDARRAAYAGAGATLLAGFDLVVWLLQAIRDVAAAWPLSMGARALRVAVPSTHLDFWIHHNERQFSPPYISLIWAPQHVAAALIALLVLRATWRATRDDRAVSRLLPAILLASVPALSAYVGIALAVGLAASVVIDSWRSRGVPWKSAAFLRWRATGLIAVAAAVPVGWVLVGGPGAQLTVGVSSAGTLLNGAVFSALLGDTTLARLLDTPALYLVEFGVVGLLGLAAIRARTLSGTLTGEQREALAVAGAILVLVTLIRPPEGGPNNLYARPMLLVWSLLACFAADAWCAGVGSGWWRRVGVAVGAGGILLGAIGATAEGLAFWATPADAVGAARWVNGHVPTTAVVATDPERHNLGYWLRRRTVVADRRHALLFGATAGQYDDTLGRLRDAYDAADPVDAARRFAELGADVVIVELPAPPWAQAPCFDVGYQGSTVMALTRSAGACAP